MTRAHHAQNSRENVKQIAQHVSSWGPPAYVAPDAPTKAYQGSSHHRKYPCQHRRRNPFETAAALYERICVIPMCASTQTIAALIVLSRGYGWPRDRTDFRSPLSILHGPGAQLPTRIQRGNKKTTKKRGSAAGPLVCVARRESTVVASLMITDHLAQLGHVAPIVPPKLQHHLDTVAMSSSCGTKEHLEPDTL